MPKGYGERLIYILQNNWQNFLDGALTTLAIAIVGTLVGCLIGFIVGIVLYILLIAFTFLLPLFVFSFDSGVTYYDSEILYSALYSLF